MPERRPRRWRGFILAAATSPRPRPATPLAAPPPGPLPEMAGAISGGGHEGQRERRHIETWSVLPCVRAADNAQPPRQARELSSKVNFLSSPLRCMPSRRPSSDVGWSRRKRRAFCSELCGQFRHAHILRSRECVVHETEASSRHRLDS